jgi:hypothetical protein
VPYEASITGLSGSVPTLVLVDVARRADDRQPLEGGALPLPPYAAGARRAESRRRPGLSPRQLSGSVSNVEAAQLLVRCGAVNDGSPGRQPALCDVDIRLREPMPDRQDAVLHSGASARKHSRELAGRPGW